MGQCRPAGLFICGAGSVGRCSVLRYLQCLRYLQRLRYLCVFAVPAVFAVPVCLRCLCVCSTCNVSSTCGTGSDCSVCSVCSTWGMGSTCDACSICSACRVFQCLKIDDARSDPPPSFQRPSAAAAVLRPHPAGRRRPASIGLYVCLCVPVCVTSQTCPEAAGDALTCVTLVLAVRWPCVTLRWTCVVLALAVRRPCAVP